MIWALQIENKSNHDMQKETDDALGYKDVNNNINNNDF